MIYQTPDVNDMPYHDREFFIARIRCGYYTIPYNGSSIRLLSPTIEQELEIISTYHVAYEEAWSNDVLTDSESMLWARENGLWTNDDDIREKTLAENKEKLLVKLFNRRESIHEVKEIRAYLNHTRKLQKEMMNKRGELTLNTCEQFAAMSQMMKFVEICTQSYGEIDFDVVVKSYNDQVAPERTIRYLARTSPWASIWSMRDVNPRLFANDGRELTIDQKNLIVWSETYDNVQQSMDCPPDAVIQDDDMLDGWFIVQRRKHEDELSKKELESKQSDKVKNSDEVFMIAKNDEEKKKIESLNTTHATHVKRDRMNLIKQKGEATQNEFLDEKLKLNNKAREAFKGKFGR